MGQFALTDAGGESEGSGSDVARTAVTGRALTVSEVALLVKGVLAEAVPVKLRVVGEISNFSDRTHWFFSLKDEAAALRCVCFASAARRCGFPLADGMQVVVTGRLDFYEVQGQLQLYVDKIEPVGLGVLDMRLRALCDELRRLGYFDPARKKPLPLVPRRVAVVTSKSGAALADVVNTARRRWAGCELLLMDVRVQGDNAAPQIAAAIRALSRHGAALGIEVIILTRGGGSMEDLWAFNERVVADAMFECSLPIVAAIGHETDVTIAELVADVRCATPTQAAMTVVPDAAALQQQVRQLQGRLNLLLRRELRHVSQRLEAVARHPVFRRPQNLLEAPQRRLDLLAGRMRGVLPQAVSRSSQRLETIARHPFFRMPRSRIEPAQKRLQQLLQRLRLALPRIWARSAERVDALARQLEALGPVNVLKRGYSYTLGPDQHVLRSVTAVQPGSRITTVLTNGRLLSTVEQRLDGPSPADGESKSLDRPAGPPGTPRVRRRNPPHNEPRLFND